VDVALIGIAVEVGALIDIELTSEFGISVGDAVGNAVGNTTPLLISSIFSG